jgi:hypothetical protein
MNQPGMISRAGLLIFLLFLRSNGLAQSPQDRFINVNGLRLHFLDWGTETKPPLILLHGIGRVGAHV